MTNTYGYYKFEDMPKVLSDGTIAGVSAVVSALETGVLGFLEGKVGLGSTILKFVTLSGQASGTVTYTLNVTFNSNDEFSIEGYNSNQFQSLNQAAISDLISIMLLGTGNIVAAIGISAGVSIAFSAIGEAAEYWYDVGDPVNIKFYDSSDQHVSGFFYPEGVAIVGNLDATIKNAITNFIVSSGNEIESGGVVSIPLENIVGISDEIEVEIINGNFIKDLVPHTSAGDPNQPITDIEDFLLAGNNLNVHAFKSSYHNDTVDYDHHYFFFEDGDVELSIPVIINGVEQVIAVNNVIRGDVLQMGDGSGKNVIYPNTANIVTATSDDDLILSANSVSGGSGEDTVIGTSGDDTLSGGDDHDTIDGGISEDSLSGDNGDDVLYGGLGNDTLIGGDGDNKLFGGEGDDWADYRYSNGDATINLGNGVVNIDEAIDNDDTLNSIEHLWVGNGSNYIEGNFSNNKIIGGSGSDTIYGQFGSDTLVGNGSADTLYGNTGDDSLVGGDGVDSLVGNHGEDTLIGGTGNDILQGGEQADKYYIGTADGEDIIRDQYGNDRIYVDLSGNGVYDKLLVGEAQENDTGSFTSWGYYLTYGGATAYMNWSGDTTLAGDRADLIIDFDATNIHDVVIEDFANGEFGITLENVAEDPNVLEDGADDAYFTSPAQGDGWEFGEINRQGPRNHREVWGNYVNPDKDLITQDDSDSTGIPVITSDSSGTTIYGAKPDAEGSLEFDLVTIIEDSFGIGEIIDDIISALAGDPHVLTYDGSFYEFQDAGEYTVVRSTDEENPFIVQSRMEEWDLGDSTGEMFSVNTAIATQIGELRVGFYIRGSLEFDMGATGIDQLDVIDDLPVLWIEDEAFFMPPNGMIILDDGFIIRNGYSDSYSVFNNEGDYFTVNIHENHIDFMSGLSETREAGTVEGLLGNYDGDKHNDFVLDSGTPLGTTISQTTLYDVFGEDWRIEQSESLFLYGNGQNTDSFDNPNFDNTLRTLADFDPALVSAAETAAIAEGFDPNADIFDSVVLDFLVTGYVEYNDVWAALEGKTLTPADVTGTDIIMGTDSGEVLYGTTGDDYIMALGGNDVVYADSGNDTIVGGTGNDVLYGHAGGDLFIHSAGDGNDTIYVSNLDATNSVQLYDGSGKLLAQEDIILHVSGNDLIVGNRTTGETLLLDNMYYSSYIGYGDVNGIDITEGLPIVMTDAAETFFGSKFGDTIEGGEGNDTIYGGYGADTFVHRAGDGNDTVYVSNLDATNSVQLYDANDELLTQDDIILHVSGNDLIVGNRTTGETLLLDNMYYSSYIGYGDVNGIDITEGLPIVMTDAAETFYGSRFGDTIEGGEGNDTIYGGHGADTFVHRAGDGNDTVYVSNLDATNSVKLYDDNDELLTQEDIILHVSGNDLIVGNRTTGETLLLDNMYYSSYIGYGDINGIDITGGLPIVMTDAAEAFYGSSFGDTIEGGEGNDTIYGGHGADMFVHRAGDGNDTVYVSNLDATNSVKLYDANDVLLTQDDIILHVSGNDLIVGNRTTGETLTLDNMYYSSYIGYGDINGIDITGGLPIVMTDAAEAFYGSSFGDTIEGGEGNDTIYGGHGADTFVHRAGDGNDTIFVSNLDATNSVQLYDANDVLLTQDDIIIHVSGNDLIVGNRTTGETLTLDNMYYSSSIGYGDINGIDITSGLPIVMTDAAETFFGSSFGDTIEGGEGDDTIYGGHGADLFIHHAGDGNDNLHVTNFDGTNSVNMYDVDDTLLEETELSFAVSGYNLLVTNLNNSETLTLGNMYYYANNPSFGMLNGIDLDTVI